jgi:hypothetical protein
MEKSISAELITGGCHCDAIRFEFHWTKPGTPISVRACGCGLCQKHRAAWASDPEGGFRLMVAKPQTAHHYRFGTKTAEFHICQTCGVLPITTFSMESQRYAVFNIHTFDDMDHTRLIEQSTDFEGEQTEGRLARRKRSWTPEL